MQVVERHYGMDWLRIGAFAVLILYHVGMFYVPWDWHVKASPVVERATVPMLFTNGWRLALLFVVSGYASAAMLAKRPALGAFVTNRSARLLIPLLFAMAVVVSPQPWIELAGKYGYVHSFGHFWLHDYFRFDELHGIRLPTWQHLWFVAYLWAYTVLLAAILSLSNGVRNSVARIFDAVLGQPIALIVLPVAWLMLRPLVFWPGVEDTHALIDDWPAHFVYIPAFLFGFALLRAQRVWRAIRQVWPWSLALALITYAIFGGLEWAYPGDHRAPSGLVVLFRIAREINAWTMIVALLGIADRYWNRDHRWRATLNEGVFPFYIVHQTLIVVIAWGCLNMGMPNAASFPLLVAATALGCWLFYRLGREIPVWRLLIGLKGWRTPTALKTDARDARLSATR